MRTQQTNSGGITEAMARMTELENTIKHEREEKEREEAMSKNIQIQTHNFVQAKKALKSFLKETEKSVHLSNVEVDGLIPIFDHNVTGRELNRLIGELEEGFVSFNKKHARTTKELRQVYEALEALDSDYISAIVMNMGAIEKTSNDAKVIAEETQKNSQKIEKTINTQKKTIEALGKVKQGLDDLDIEGMTALLNLVNTQKKQLKGAYFISACAVLMSLGSIALHFVGI